MSLFIYLFKVKNDHNISFYRQIKDILRLRFGKMKLGASEYYDYGLYLINNSSQQDEFIGWRTSKLIQSSLTAPGWLILSTNKFIFYSLCVSYNLPIPKLYGLYSQSQLTHQKHVPTFSTINDVRQFLIQNVGCFPVFAKPIHAWHGRGGFGIASYDVISDCLFLTNNTRISLDDFYKKYLIKEKSGYIFQEMLKIHPKIKEVCGDRLCTLRLWVLTVEKKPQVVRGLWKVAIGNNMTDNTMHGKTGNYYGPVDIETGRVIRQIKSAGFNEELVFTHPDTGKQTVDIIIPQWKEALALCENAAALFYGFKIQAWDIAITESGPKIVELSMPGDIDGPQFAYRKGMFDDLLKKALSKD